MPVSVFCANRSVTELCDCDHRGELAGVPAAGARKSVLNRGIALERTATVHATELELALSVKGAGSSLAPSASRRAEATSAVAVVPLVAERVSVPFPNPAGYAST